MLELSGLRLSYPGFTLSADLSVPSHARVALIGPSGAGKSTLLSAIAGFLTPDAGDISLDGKSLTQKKPGDRGVAMVFQDQNLFPHMSAFDNVALALSSNLRLSSGQKDQVIRALSQVGLNGFEDRKPGELSGGQQARVTLARVLLQRVRMLLLDEPFGALGPGLRREMLDLVGQLCTSTDMGLLMVTHDPGDALALCDQTIVVTNGQAAPPRPTQDVLDRPSPDLAAYLGRVND